MVFSLLLTYFHLPSNWSPSGIMYFHQIVWVTQTRIIHLKRKLLLFHRFHTWANWSIAVKWIIALFDYTAKWKSWKLYSWIFCIIIAIFSGFLFGSAFTLRNFLHFSSFYETTKRTILLVQGGWAALECTVDGARTMTRVSAL